MGAFSAGRLVTTRAGVHFSGQSRLEELRRMRIWRVNGAPAGTGLKNRCIKSVDRQAAARVEVPASRARPHVQPIARYSPAGIP
jgi:hypothetical protein